MATYEAKTVTVTTTYAVVVTADGDVDRRVIITDTGNNLVKVSFDGENGAVVFAQPNGQSRGVESFILPEDENLYMQTVAGTTLVGLIITKA